MKTVSASKYVEGVESIYEEQPSYETGHDGSDGKCDCIGMCRGGLERAGATDITNMRGTNQAARKTIRNLQELKSADVLYVGDVVLKTRDKDDPNMPLPDQYRKGGSEYDPTWGETNFTHIGTVSSVDPLVITHMTSPSAKRDTKIKGWGYFGELPWVEYEPAPDPGPEPEPEIEKAIVVAEKGNTVKMRAKPSIKCGLYWDVPVGSEVIVDEWNAKDDGQRVWSLITWNYQMGYMIQDFLQAEDDPGEKWIVIIPGLTKDQAEEISALYPGSYVEKEGG